MRTQKHQKHELTTPVCSLPQFLHPPWDELCFDLPHPSRNPKGMLLIHPKQKQRCQNPASRCGAGKPLELNTHSQGTVRRRRRWFGALEVQEWGCGEWIPGVRSRELRTRRVLPPPAESQVPAPVQETHLELWDGNLG